MIEIDEQALQGKLTNQRDENCRKTGVWVWLGSKFATFEKSNYKGWRSMLLTHSYWLCFQKNSFQIIDIDVDENNNKIIRKTITI